MFEVRCSYKMDENWTKKDEMIYTVVGKVSCWAGMGCSEKGDGTVRHHGWEVCTFDQAVKVKDDLEDILDLSVSIKEK